MVIIIIMTDDENDEPISHDKDSYELTRSSWDVDVDFGSWLGSFR